MLDLADCVHRTSSMLRRFIGEDITLEVSAEDRLPRVYADPAMVDELLLNLVINARDAMPHGGNLTVSVSKTAGLPGGQVCLTVSDTGSGIDAESLPRIFEPFFTTKDVGKGTGLGLATAFGIVEQHGGRIEVDSEAGRGATFRVLLPVGRGPAESGADAGILGAAQHEAELVMVVDDDRALREITSHVLTEHGYRVMQFSSGSEALKALEHEPISVDLLLTDVVMPGGVSGKELAQHMAARAPSLRVMFMSGYSHDVLGSDVEALAPHAFLAKPFTAAELLLAVQARLAKPLLA